MSNSEIGREPVAALAFGYELIFRCSQRTPLLLLLRSHPNYDPRAIVPDVPFTDPAVPVTTHRDVFGNRCMRLVIPKGSTLVMAKGVVSMRMANADAGEACEHPVETLPPETLPYLLGSRYCDLEFLMQPAWNLFGAQEPGRARVQAICDYARQSIVQDPGCTRDTKTARDTFREHTGVVKDLTHLVIALCRCLNIPARYCTGYRAAGSDHQPEEPLDFAIWMEAYLGGAWRAFDPCHDADANQRILIARGRDAADVPFITSFGPSTIERQRVWIGAANAARHIPVPLKRSA